MGNEQPKKIPRINKTQIQMASLKAKIHLELMRDRRTQQIIKGEKQLVSKLNVKSRNYTQQGLIMERVVNGLKYTQAVNQLISYAASLRSQANFLCQNIGNQQKIEPWLVHVHSLLYASDQLGLSSLIQFKTAIRALNDPLLAEKFVNPQIKQMLSPTPTPYEVNIYVLEMCQRNNIDLEVVNAAGHKFSHNPHPQNSQLDKSFTDIERQLASKFQKQLHNNQENRGNHGQGFSSGNGGWGNGNNGSLGNNSGKFSGKNSQNGGNGGYDGSFPSKGFGGQNNNPTYYDNVVKKNTYDSNPYKGLSNLKQGPTYFTPSQVQPVHHQQKPNEFTSFDDINLGDAHKEQPIYPSVNPNIYQNQAYNAPKNAGNGTDGGSKNVNQKSNGGSDAKSPTISQIMRDFDLK